MRSADLGRARRPIRALAALLVAGAVLVPAGGRGARWVRVVFAFRHVEPWYSYIRMAGGRK